MEKFFQPVNRKIEPEWFRLGRDAARVMNQLGGMRELDFYLRHPEPFIRLLAIRRVAVLLLPDAIPTLTRMLDDPLENEQNRDEAGWAIRRISHAKGLAWFARNPYTDKYDGSELPSSRFGVTVLENAVRSGITVPEGLIQDARLEDEVLLRIQMDEKGLEVSFSPLSWITSNFGHLLAGLIKGTASLFKKAGMGLFRLILMAGKGLGAILAGLFSHLADRRCRIREERKTKDLPPQGGAFNDTAVLQRNPGFPDPVHPAGYDIDSGHPVHTTEATHTVAFSQSGNATAITRPAGQMLIGLEEAISSGATQTQRPVSVRDDQEMNLRPIPASTPALVSTSISAPNLRSMLPGLSENKQSVRTTSRRRKGGASMFKLLFYPVRLVRQHWAFTLAVLIVFYAFLGFTHSGRFVMSRLNPQVLWSNDRFVAVSKLMFIDFFHIETSPNGAGTDKTASAIGTAEKAANLSAPPSGKETLAPTESTATQYKVTAAKGLSLRTEPLKTSDRILLMPTGTLVSPTGERQKDDADSEWVRVTTDGKTGWAMAQWLAPLVTAGENGGTNGNP